MNEYERRNLERLAKQNEQARQVMSLINESKAGRVKEIAEDGVRLLVRVLFDLHNGDLLKIKTELRADADIIKGLNLEQIVNNEYKRQANPARIRARYNKETQARFWATIIRLEAEQSSRRRIRTTGKSDTRPPAAR